jgi:hypothetical protein
VANKFGQQLKDFAEKTGQELEDVDVAFKFALFDRVFRGTPVDTGRLRANWQITNDTPATNAIAAFDEVAEGTPLDQSAELLIKPFSVTYLANNLIYAVAMEERYQMVGRAIINARSALARAIAKDD